MMGNPSINFYHPQNKLQLLPINNNLIAAAEINPLRHHLEKLFGTCTLSKALPICRVKTDETRSPIEAFP